MSLELNTQQQAHLDWVVGKQKSNRLIIATLSGPAGTGKTFLVNRMSYVLPGVQMLAPTNPAALLVNGRTIHSFFKMLPIDADAPIIEFSKELVFDDESVRTIILDECSMVTNDMIKRIRSACIERNINLLCVGDEYQLPPVDIGEDDDEEKVTSANCCFDSSLFTQLKLTEIVRQAADSSIIKLSSHYRQYGYSPKWEDIVTPKMIIKGDVLNLTRDCKSSFVNGEKVVTWGNKWLAHWDKDTIAVGFTNKSVIDMNKKINATHHNDGKLFHAGDTIVLKTPVYYPAGTVFNKDGEEVTIFASLSNGSDVKILSALETTHTVRTLRSEKKTLRCFKINFAVGDDNRVISRMLLHYDSYADYKKYTDEYKKAWKKSSSEVTKELWKASGFKEVIRAYHEYASTIHLSQGKTHKNTMLMVTSMYPVRDDISLYNRLAYVACTRPKNKLILTGAIYK